KGNINTLIKDAHLQNNHPILLVTQCQLDAYFNNTLTTFDVPLAMTGTDFQKTVWQYLCSIPYGATTTYGQIAKELGKPKAQQAVGAANSKNPLSIIVPCHRVVGAKGQLVGYAGGLHNKAYLLHLENKEATLF